MEEINKEMIDINDFIRTAKSFGSDFLNKIIPIVNRADVYFNYEKVGGNITRIILRIRKNNNVHPLFYYYCNGCVIDTIEWKPLVVPPITFNKRKNPETIESFYNQGLYDVIKVIDGTVVTFYYFRNQWNISSSNSYDVSTFYWIGNMTYAEVIYDLFTRLYSSVAEKYGLEFVDDRLDFTQLSKSKCYTIGFRHHNFHPLKKDPERMWNIQHVNLTNGYVSFNDGIKGLPNQPVINAVSSMDQLNFINKTSISEATKENPTFNYGYILRSKNPSLTKEYSSVILRSSLLKKIKKNIYEYPDNALKQCIDHTNRFEFISMKNFFNKAERNEMSQLYPQLLERFPLYSKCVDETVECSLAIVRNKQQPVFEPLKYQACIIALAYSLLGNVSKFEALDPYHQDTESVLKDYYSSAEYSILFLNAISKYNYNK